jgi:RimJ/RimL family protein N-acetyltransferase
MTVHLEPFCHEDLEFMRGLRNAHRKWFFNTKPVDPWQQEEWYLQYLASNVLFWTVWDNSTKVGIISRKPVLSVYLSGDGMTTVYELGNLMLLPAWQGRGIMQEAMRLITIMSPYSFYIAHVKSDNAASLRCFKNAGFWRVPKGRKKNGR